MLSMYNSHVSLGHVLNELSQVNNRNKFSLKTDFRCKTGKISTCAFILAQLIMSRIGIKVIYAVFIPFNQYYMCLGSKLTVASMGHYIIFELKLTDTRKAENMLSPIISHSCRFWGICEKVTDSSPFPFFLRMRLQSILFCRVHRIWQTPK